MKTGLIYDPIYLEHDTGAHVESPQRLSVVVEHLKKAGLWEKLILLAPREASEEEVALVHTQEHINYIRSMAEGGGGWLDADTVVSPSSYQVALWAVGGLLRGVEAVMGGEVGNAFALVRPPGHHASPGHAMGFCLLNNAAIAARYAQQRYSLERVLIVDFDVHHGNGTQAAFYQDPSVHYFSLHEYPFYPGTGALDEIGSGMGRGATVNIPLPAGSSDKDYISAFGEVLVPLARRFEPQLILVSAGYDAHRSDPIAMMQVSVSCFREMAMIIRDLARELCQGRLLFTLEGGYNLEALPHCIHATLAALMEKAAFDPWLGRPTSGDLPDLDRAPSASGKRRDIRFLLEEVKRLHNLG